MIYIAWITAIFMIGPTSAQPVLPDVRDAYWCDKIKLYYEQVPHDELGIKLPEADLQVGYCDAMRVSNQVVGMILVIPKIPVERLYELPTSAQKTVVPNLYFRALKALYPWTKRGDIVTVLSPTYPQH